MQRKVSIVARAPVYKAIVWLRPIGGQELFACSDSSDSFLEVSKGENIVSVGVDDVQPSELKLWLTYVAYFM